MGQAVNKGSGATMATMSWSSGVGAPGSTLGHPAAPSKDVAEDPALTHSFWVPEAHVGMMVTPSVKLLRPLGEGGMGTVWVAEHLALHTQVVVKFISADLKNSKEATERFSREAAAAAQVKSPHVVQTFDHGFTTDGTPYIVMELLEGRDLGAFLDTQRVCPPELVISIISQLGRALDRAHERGIVHRDIKPGNIFLCDAGDNEVFVKLLDFGIAKGVDVPLIDSGTKTGAMIGSPFYMSPEQILGSKSVDARSDLWSVGVVTFEALTGRKPFDAETMGGLAIKIHSEPLPSLSTLNPRLSPAVDVWFQRACARASSDRFHSARELAESLAAALGGEMPRSVDAPRVTTGSNPDLNPAVASGVPNGASTQAGVVTSSTQSGTRNRLLALAAFATVLFAGTFMGVTFYRKGDSKWDARSANVTSTDATVATVTTPPAASPPPSTSQAVAPIPSLTLPSMSESPPPSATMGSSRPSPKGTAHAHPIKPTSPSARPPLPSATTPPAPTGHDIF